MIINSMIYLKAIVLNLEFKSMQLAENKSCFDEYNFFFIFNFKMHES